MTVDRDNRTESKEPVFSNTGQHTLSTTPWLQSRKLLILLPVLFLVAFLFFGGSGLVHGKIGKTITAPRSTNALTGSNIMTRQEAITQARLAVVSIDVFCQRSGRGSASGVIIDPRGYIVTNYHVVGDSNEFHVMLFDDSMLPAQLVGVDPSDDLAVLKIETAKHLHALPIGNSSQLQVGDDVLMIGSPLTILPGTVTNGIISALGRTPEENESGIIGAIQHSVPVDPGDSGTALLNMRAQLVGIHTSHPRYTDHIPVLGIGFAIPANRVKFIVSQLMRFGKVTHHGHATIGVTAVTVDPELAEQDSLSVDHGAFVADMDENSPAAQAGLQSEDVIVRVNNIPIDNATDLIDALMSEDPDSTVTLGIIRGSQSMQVDVKLAEQEVKGPPIEPCPSTEPTLGKG